MMSRRSLLSTKLWTLLIYCACLHTRLNGAAESYFQNPKSYAEPHIISPSAWWLSPKIRIRKLTNASRKVLPPILFRDEDRNAADGNTDRHQGQDRKNLRKNLRNKSADRRATRSGPHNGGIHCSATNSFHGSKLLPQISQSLTWILRPMNRCRHSTIRLFYCRIFLYLGQFSHWRLNIIS